VATYNLGNTGKVDRWRAESSSERWCQS